MKKRLILIFSLMLSFMTSGFFYAVQANEPTRIRIGLAGATPNQSVQGLNISTAEIDEVLRDTAGPFGISDHYTSDLANDVFEKVDQVEVFLENKLRPIIRDIDHVQYIYSLDVQANPVQFTLSQDGTRLGARLGTFNGNASIKGAYGWCGSFRVDVTIKDISLLAEYDVYTGRIINTRGDYEVTQGDIKPYGAIGWICKQGYDIYNKIKKGSGTKTTLIKNGIRDALNDFIGDVEAYELFSLEDFLESTEAFIQTVESPSFSYASYSLPPIPANSRRDATDAIEHINDILSSPSFQGTGLRLTLELIDGYNSNQINLIVSHAPTKLSNIEMEDECGRTNVSFGDRTQFADIYWRPSSYGGWIKKSTTYWNGSYNLGKIQDGSQFIAIGKSSLFGNLYSKPEDRNIVTYRRDRNRPLPIFDTFCGGFLDDGDLPDFPDFPAFP